MLAGAGDELQGIKRGVMELADLVAINKADGANLSPPRERAQMPRTLCIISLLPTPAGHLALSPAPRKPAKELPNSGMPCLSTPLSTRANGWFAHARQPKTQHGCTRLSSKACSRFESKPAIRQRMATLEKDVLAGRTTSFRAARTLLEMYADPPRIDTH